MPKHTNNAISAKSKEVGITTFCTGLKSGEFESFQPDISTSCNISIFAPIDVKTAQLPPALAVGLWESQTKTGFSPKSTQLPWNIIPKILILYKNRHLAIPESTRTASFLLY